MRKALWVLLHGASPTDGLSRGIGGTQRRKDPRRDVEVVHATTQQAPKEHAGAEPVYQHRPAEQTPTMKNLSTRGTLTTQQKQQNTPTPTHVTLGIHTLDSYMCTYTNNRSQPYIRFYSILSATYMPLHTSGTALPRVCSKHSSSFTTRTVLQAVLTSLKPGSHTENGCRCPHYALSPPDTLDVHTPLQTCKHQPPTLAPCHRLYWHIEPDDTCDRKCGHVPEPHCAVL
jgi:hypothetical protein